MIDLAIAATLALTSASRDAAGWPDRLVLNCSDTATQAVSVLDGTAWTTTLVPTSTAPYEFTIDIPAGMIDTFRGREPARITATSGYLRIEFNGFSSWDEPAAAPHVITYVGAPQAREGSLAQLAVSEGHASMSTGTCRQVG